MTGAPGSVRNWSLLVTCEHGGNEVPDAYRSLFKGRDAALASHRGWDPGALDLARRLAGRLRAPVIAATVTRLLVELNRSERHPRALSAMTRMLPRAERERLLARYHRPHRRAVARVVAEAIRGGHTVLHLGIHSFTPLLDRDVRRADVALLYDPGRAHERGLTAAWSRALRACLPGRSVRRNYPYRGRSDGLTTTLRRLHDEEAYLGIEVEVNQKHLGAKATFPSWVEDALADSLGVVLGQRTG